ncbi:hypothetical protein BS47DRAFT_1361905 [Hydnum rufescens UP504]|uniref:Uncharacterized protein n=1 Tax=Hydnum rufescens UP504 TaxID=1448309 RepID=A0A9P6AYB7_9AGAM|nr:hypothetical protein BS47DRAFT_1361905 [Hydnum rufescens UP504]
MGAAVHTGPIVQVSMGGVTGVLVWVFVRAGTNDLEYKIHHSPLAKPHPGMHRQVPGQNTGACAATQDANVPHTHFGRYLHQMKFKMNVCSHPIQEPSTPTPAIYAMMDEMWYHTPTVVGPFSHYETPSEASTDEAQGENRACVVKSSAFSHCETPPKAAEMKARAKHRHTQAPESPAPKHP